MLHVENVTIENAYKNLIDTDLQHVTISNVSALSQQVVLLKLELHWIQHTAHQAK